MRFEWDERKARTNLAKHRISFEEATEVFYDPSALENFDPGHSSAESRFFIIGLSSRRLLYVVFVEPEIDLVRILSARKASIKEQNAYERTIHR